MISGGVQCGRSCRFPQLWRSVSSCSTLIWFLEIFWQNKSFAFISKIEVLLFRLQDSPSINTSYLIVRKTTASGVPQGSILGPILFLIYTADWSSVIRFTSLKCFADDTQLVHYVGVDETVHSSSREMNSNISEIYLDSTNHNLTINSN